MRRLLTLALLVLIPLAGGAASAQDTLPDRRLTLSEGVDFYGADLSQTFDTSLPACQAACLGDAACRAFTFNARSLACFTKSDIRDRLPYAGAISGEVTLRDAQALATARIRAGELSFLSSRDLAAAQAEALALPARHPRTGVPAVELLQEARAARASGNPGAALRLIGEALGITDQPDLWADYARLALDLPEEDYTRREALRAQALAGAINGYLRADTTAGRVAALEVMADALDRLDRGRDIIPALRLAQAIAPRDDLAARLETAEGQYGFRVTDNTVDSDAADPRLCIAFSEPLIAGGHDYAPFVQTDMPTPAVQVTDRQLCLAGGQYGTRYRVTLRQGLPAASGETLRASVTVQTYIRDRAPSVRFPGNGYVLPAGEEVALPVISVNVEALDLSLWRISDRNTVRALQEDLFAQPVPQYRQDDFEARIAQKVWQGTGEVAQTLNRDVTTRLPLDGVLPDAVTPGIYALQARIPGSDPWDNPAATQWFVVSDLGLLTMQGTDGLHAIVRGLGDALPVAGVTLDLVSRANAVLGRAQTDAQGIALFAPGLTRGTDGAAPAMLIARAGDDMAFLPLTGPEFDLSDRGVEGRAPAGPIDVWLTTDRGVYRAGETVHATALLRDGRARALPGVPVTAILTRPDGVEYARQVSTDDRAGGHVLAFATQADVPRGTWRLDILADPQAPVLASADLLIEDFLPERVDADLTLPDGPLTAYDRPVLDIAARYLFGAPAADLGVEVELRTTPARALDAWPGYLFGRHDADFGARSDLMAPVRTDMAGRATLPLILPDDLAPGQPSELRVLGRIAEGSGRPIERDLTRTILPPGPMIGLRAGFDGILPEGSRAAFKAVLTGGESRAARWSLNRLRTDYQWYAIDGAWFWDPVVTRTSIASGDIALGETPADIAVDVEWGDYELVVETAGGDFVSASVAFTAGWYAPQGLTDTPDLLQVSLDADRYAVGDTARLRLVPRMAGQVLVSIVADRVIDMRSVAVAAGETTLDLPVTADWGPGAYVTATFLAPASDDAGPSRSLGVAHAAVDPGPAQLAVTLDAPASALPRAPLEVTLRVAGGRMGETVHATLAAVDVGVLNLTRFEAPDPSAWYFGQRKLGVALRDLYGRLIDPGTGAMGAVRSGGDAAANMTLQAPPPDDVLALFQGPVRLGADGRATLSLDLPAINGTVRLMAVAWSATGVGQAQADVAVRDPVVAQVTLPRFLAPGDTSRMLVELTQADGPAGSVGIELTGSGVTLGRAPVRVVLEMGETQRFSVPIAAGPVGVAQIDNVLTSPGDVRLAARYTLPIRRLDPQIQRTSRFDLAPGATFTLDDQAFDGLSSGTVTLTAGALARLDVPGLLAGLDRYPYGCTEQTASAAMPLLYLSQVARAMGLDGARGLEARLSDAVRRVLVNQAANGSFGLWGPDSGDFWLDAYNTDFLSRARAQGVAVPDLAFRAALDNLANRVAYAPDFDAGGEDIAYALHVLAREGAASTGDLRYYADTKAGAFGSPLALAQLGAALAAYGDPTRADALFAQAAAQLRDVLPEQPVWRDDYGTPLRDRAGVLTLAVEAGSDAIDRDALAATLVTDQPLSTQEAVWSLLAANALIAGPGTAGLSVDGVAATGPLIEVRQAQADAAPVLIRNDGATPATLTLTALGVPDIAPPRGGTGLSIERTYFDLQGTPVDPGGVAVGTRLVAVLSVQPFGRVESRLMVDDPLPAGFEIDNPNLLRSGDVRDLDWLVVLDDVAHVEFRADRFLAAVDWRSDAAFRLAYIVRAVSPGSYAHPAASVSDMYRPRFRAQTDTGRVTVTE